MSKFTGTQIGRSAGLFVFLFGILFVLLVSRAGFRSSVEKIIS